MTYKIFEEKLRDKKELKIFEFIFKLQDDRVLVYNIEKGLQEFPDEKFSISEIFFVYQKIIRCFGRKRACRNKDFGTFTILKDEYVY